MWQKRTKDVILRIGEGKNRIECMGPLEVYENVMRKLSKRKEVVKRSGVV